MAPKRKSDEAAAEGLTGRQKKKQKTEVARTIAVQSPSISGSATPHNAIAGPSKSVRFDGTSSPASSKLTPNSYRAGSVQLPGSLDVERFAEARAFEINAMHNAMKSARANATHRAWQQLPRYLRRRAASHDVRRVPLRLRDKAKAEMDPMRRKALGRSMPKLGKKRRLTRIETFLRRQRDKTWLETHLWHAKRMKMENMWGYRLAVQPTEKAFRPSHRASVHGSILHDASYYGFIEFKGPEHALRAILDSCCDFQGPSPGAKRFLTGARACDTHIYEYGSYPFGLIAPVTVIWRAAVSTTTTLPSSRGVQQPTPASSSSPGKRKRKGSKGKQPVEAQNPAEFSRTLWIRVHPTAFDDVFLSLRTSASFALEAAKKAASDSQKVLEVEIADLRERLNVFEIMGPKSSQVIKGSLKPVNEDKRDEFKKCWNGLANLQTTASLPRNMVIGFKVNDPRLTFPPKNAKVHIEEGRLPSASPVATIFPTSTLAQSEIWDENIRDRLRKPRYKKKDIDQRRSQNIIPGTSLQAQRQDDRIPVLLIQRSLEDTSCTQPTANSGHPKNSPSLHGWTLIIPSGWSMPFFSSLTFTGTRVAGQRERQTQAFEAGCAYFPKDYPCTKAYQDYAEEREDEERSRWERKPPAKRPNFEKLGTRSPWTPDWDVVLGLVDKSSSTPGGAMDESEDYITAQRENEPSQAAEGAATTSKTPPKTIRPWLLRGPEVHSVLDAASTMFNHSVGLLEQINKLRAKRKQEPLDASIRAEELWKGALVLVKVLLCGRGRPGDLALIYRIDDDEHRSWTNVDAARKQGGSALLGEGNDEAALSAIVPSQDRIIGYVTTGNFSLSLGEGYAIGAIPVARLFELKEQAKRMGAGKALLVKIRDREDNACRAAHLEVLEG